MPVSKQYFSITPINNIPVSVSSAGGPTDTFSNGFRHQGNPTVKFSIPASERLLEVGALRLTGQFITLNNSNSILSKTNLNEVNGANFTAAACAQISPFGGVHNCLDKVVIQSKKSNTELSNQTNYPLYANLRQAHQSNADDYIQLPLMRSLAAGTNGQFVNRRLNITPASNALDLTGNGGANNKNVGQHFSIALETPLLRSNDIHLGQNFANGLMITLHLNTSAAVYGQLFRDLDTSGGGQPSADISQFSYVLKNLRLEGRYIVPLPQELKAYPSVLTMRDRLNLINDIQSSNDSDNYSPNLNMVSSFSSVALDEDQQNNLTFEQNNFRLPVGLKQNTQSKDSLRFPFDYPVPVVPNFESPLDNPSPGVTAITIGDIQNKYAIQGDAEVRMHFAKSIMGQESRHSSASVDLTNSNLNADYEVRGGTAATTGVGSQGFPDLLGLGADYSYGLGNFQQFSGSDYNLNTESGVKTQDGNLPASRNDKNEVLQTYVNHLSQLNLQSLVKTM